MLAYPYATQYCALTNCTHNTLTVHCTGNENPVLGPPSFSRKRYIIVQQVGN